MVLRKHYIIPSCEVVAIALQQMIAASEDRDIDKGSQDGQVYDGDGDMPGGGSAAPRWMGMDED